ncbi:MAG: hypothetical protein R3B69_03240 [Candidatus Paceibacterota bacterium]
MALKAPLTVLFGGLTTGVVLGALFVVGVFLTFNTGLRFPSSTPHDELEEEELEEGKRS